MFQRIMLVIAMFVMFGATELAIPDTADAQYYYDDPYYNPYPYYVVPRSPTYGYTVSWGVFYPGAPFYQGNGPPYYSGYGPPYSPGPGPY